MQGNCAGPPSEEEAKQLNLQDSVVESLQSVKPGQCVIVIDKSAFLTKTYNKWFDNLHIAFVSDNLLPGTVTAISASKDIQIGPATNLFLTRMAFHAMDGFRAARAFSIPPDQPENKKGVPGSKTTWMNARHSIFFQGMQAYMFLQLIYKNVQHILVRV